MPLASDTFHEVIQCLDTHEESLRIKKLIFCICKKYWENDPNILNSVPLKDLIRELVQFKSSNEQLTFSVYKLVKTLNRPKVYASVAKIIIDEVSKLYNASDVYETQLLSAQKLTEYVSDSLEDSDILLEQIAASFKNHQEESRIKKLLFAACKNRWENDVTTIDNCGIKNIILELKRNNPDKNSLKQSLNKIAENINKKSLYLAIANLIYNQIKPLYETDVDYEEHEGNEPQSQIFDTQIIHIQNAFNKTQVSEKNYAARSADFETSIIDLGEPQIITELHFVEPVSVQIHRKDYDPFELRLEILQYTNPLRSKILLFSILFHPWDRSGQDWSTLRSYTLEDLLEQLIQSGKNIKDIEAQLYRISKSQTDVDASIQTSGILVQALQRIL